ncbi:MAG: 5'/3'-nucleotidase SurE [Anaerolineales bacterium]|nr:5'/3'-nucleotidase SurE [Anaerolineales bacterium]
MNILITNDDGVNAPGLVALCEHMGKLGNVYVLAPDKNWSASGHVKTMHRPLRVRETTLANGFPALTTDGAPSDCVALALLGLIPVQLDLLVSGINPTANVGFDVTYSGTVTAAMEAVIWGVPAMAVSLDSPGNHADTLDYSQAAQAAVQVAEFIGANGLMKGILLNVNVPYRPDGEIRGVKTTRQGLRVYRHSLVERADPRGRPHYWIGGDPPTGVPENGTDIGALTEGYISVTPLQLDLTAYRSMDSLRDMTLDHR